MYGSVSRWRVKPGNGAEFEQLLAELLGDRPPGAHAVHVYRADTDPQEYWSAGIFESRDAYTSNSASPDTTGNYERTRTHGVRFRVARRGDRHFALSTAPEGLAPHLASGDHCLPDADFPPRIECASLNP
jgi:heme-degrading monooxygenase HmoA